MTILDKIIAQKKMEVEQLKANGFERFSDSLKKVESIFPGSDSMHIISEIKRSSPSKGAIDMAVDPVSRAKQYEKFGASAISVLTDKTFFNGSMEDLRAVREAVDLPLLCKDFMIDTIQIDQAKNAGATIILLIVAALSESKLRELYHYAKQHDLEVLCEVHNEAEMEVAINLGANLIGVNNRNLKTFEVDLNVTEKLAPMIRESSTTLISESGIRSRADVERAAQAGAKGILVGETLMRSDDLAATFLDLQVPLPSKGVNSNAR
ncbi:indole-3-glycerol phosphate synthase TrpC [Virgibacillus necropolis]|uniref:Indole-3-glycerol phosphate synthase n=1 Tax=Virgibacillus necropolis TaxID=163877 RepID=A0A221MHZ2_9BACI|nr:indole-3-glycerol phosphate synthase TrpC [Virgibacillus necropolis]ASN07222.1 indole-3-glycerol-phosphate synthase [Virgibacillus necropolis]